MIWVSLVLALAPPVTLSVDACAQVSPPEVRRVVELELLSTRAASTGLNAVVSCEGLLLRLNVEDVLTGKTLSRTVDLSDAALNARSRLLALAIVEIVEASWSEQLFAPEPVVSVAAPAPPPPVPQVVAVMPSRPLGKFRLTAIATSRALVTTPLWQWGGGARVAHSLFRNLGWAGELTGESGSFETNLGTVMISSGGGALEVFGQLELGSVTLQLSAGGRGGLVNARGIPHVPLVIAKNITSGWAGPLIALSASLGIGWWLVTARVEGGSALAGLSAHVENTNTGMDGPWVGLAMGFGIRP